MFGGEILGLLILSMLPKLFASELLHLGSVLHSLARNKM